MQVVGIVALAVWIFSRVWQVDFQGTNESLFVCDGAVTFFWSDVDHERSINIERVDYRAYSMLDMFGPAWPQLYGIGHDFGVLSIPLWPWPFLAIATSRWFRSRSLYQRLRRVFVHLIHHRAFRFGRRLAGALIMAIAVLSLFSFAGVAWGWAACIQLGWLEFTWWYESPHPVAAWFEWSGFGLSWQWPSFVHHQGDIVSAYIPAWMLFPVGVFLLAYRSKSPKIEPCCSKCGYILIGNQSGICSECGTAITSPPIIKMKSERENPPAQPDRPA